MKMEKGAEKRVMKGGKGHKGHPDVKKPQKRTHVIRVGETNLDGSKPVITAIRTIKGVSFSYASAVSKAFGKGGTKVSELSEEEIKKLEDIITNPGNHGIPGWMYNRRRDPDSGNDAHLTTSQLQFKQRMDVNKQKKIKSYRGVRHMFGLPVRGQRTRGAFRKGKLVGVSKDRAKRQAASKEKKE